MGLNDGQVTGGGAIPKGVSYSSFNQLSNEPLFTSQQSLQAKMSCIRSRNVSCWMNHCEGECDIDYT